jgi:membrane associated rhomboid family serine protease
VAHPFPRHTGPLVVLPISDANPTRRTPVVTLLLIAANVLTFVVLQPWRGDACTQQAFFLDWAAVPDEIVTGEPLDQSEVDATSAPCPITADPGKSVYLSVLSAMFLHAGWGHLLGNMLYLWIFGNNVEDRLGRVRFLGFYLLCGVVATLVFAFVNANSRTTLVGASGAIAGVLGAYLVLYPRARIMVFIAPFFFVPLPATIVLIGWFVLQLYSGRVADMAGGGVAYLAHVAGFVTGAVLVLGLRGRQPQRPDYPPISPRFPQPRARRRW